MKEDLKKTEKNEQRQFESGAVRDSDANKPRPDLISPWFLLRLGELMKKGAEHYGEHNWCKGIPSSQYFASLYRHLLAYASGKTDEDHLAAMAFNVMGLIHNEEAEKIINENGYLAIRQGENCSAITPNVDFPVWKRRYNGEDISYCMNSVEVEENQDPTKLDDFPF